MLARLSSTVIFTSNLFLTVNQMYHTGYNDNMCRDPLPSPPVPVIISILYQVRFPESSCQNSEDFSTLMESTDSTTAGINPSISKPKTIISEVYDKLPYLHMLNPTRFPTNFHKLAVDWKLNKDLERGRKGEFFFLLHITIGS